MAQPPVLVIPFVTPDKRHSRADPGSMAEKPGSGTLGSRIVALARPVRDDNPGGNAIGDCPASRGRDKSEWSIQMFGMRSRPKTYPEPRYFTAASRSNR